MVERPDHDDVDVTRQDPSSVGDGFAATELHLLASQHDGLPSELAHGDVEGDPRAGRRLVEDHGERLALERPRTAGASSFHGTAGVDHPAQFPRGNVDEIEKRASAVGAHPAAPSLRAVVALAMRAQARSIRLTASATSSSLTI